MTEAAAKASNKTKASFTEPKKSASCFPIGRGSRVSDMGDSYHICPKGTSLFVLEFRGAGTILHGFLF